MKNAIIIGAGPAGLTCALDMLKKTDIHPIVLEETEEIGGISRTVEYNGNRIDIGGHRFFSKNDDVMDFWREIMPIQGFPAKDDIILGRDKEYEVGGPDPETEDKVILKRHRVSRILYLRKFFDYPISLKFETIANLGIFRTMYAGFGYVFSAIFKRKEKSLEDFMVNRFGTPLYRMFFEDYNIKVWGKSPAEMAPDWGAQRIKGLSLMKAIVSMFKSAFGKKSKDIKNVETSLIEEFWYPKMGPGQLWETVADEIVTRGGELRKSCKVVKVNVSGGNVTSVTIDHDGKLEDLEADYFISTMPIKDLFESFSNKSEIQEAAYNTAVSLPYRDFMTVGVLVDKLKLINKTGIKTVSNVIPDCWIYVQERDVKIGRMQVFNNWSPYMVKDLENTVWVGLEYFCNENDEMWNMSDEDFINFALDEIIKINIIESRENVKDTIRIKVKKAYPAYYGVYDNFPKVREYLDTISNLYCIGRNGQHRYNNMDHSMLTAMECVKAIQNDGVGRELIWNVNTEQDYHESKQNDEKSENNATGV